MSDTTHEQMERICVFLVKQGGRCDDISWPQCQRVCPGNRNQNGRANWCASSTAAGVSRTESQRFAYKAAKARRWLIENSQRTDVDALIREGA